MCKRTFFKLSIIFGAFLFLSCGKDPKPQDSPRSQESTKSEIAQIEQEVLASFKKYQESLNKGDLNTVASYFSNDPRFYWVENGIMAYPSGAAARKRIKDLYPVFKKITFISSDQKVTPINRSLAMLYVQYTQLLVLPTDQEIEIKGTMTILMKKKETNWEFVIGHSSGKNQNTKAPNQ